MYLYKFRRNLSCTNAQKCLQNMQFLLSNMMNQSVISEDFQYEGNFVVVKSGKKYKKLLGLKTIY